jgi:protein DJ-1
MAPSALIFLAQGTEETEFVATYDVLARAGVRVQSVYVGSSSQSSESGGEPHGAALATCSRGVRIAPDLRLPDLAGGKGLEYDALIVPGGNDGAATISANEDVQKLLSAAYGKGKVVAAICAGSLAIKAANIAPDSAITSHPSVKDQLSSDYRVSAACARHACCCADSRRAQYKEDRVVVAEKLITR